MSANGDRHLTATGAMPAGPLRALVVDDDALLRAMVADALAGTFTCVTATCRSEALEVLARDAFDLIVADHYLPDGTGIELLAESRAHQPDALRFLVTGSPSIELALSAVNEAAVDRFYVKPLDTEAIREEAARGVRARHADLALDRRIAARRQEAAPPAARVLVVCSDTSARQIVEGVLAMEDHQVEVAEEGKAALDRLGARSFDLLVCERDLPDGSGIELLGIARNLHPDLAGLVLLEATDGGLDGALGPSSYDYLRKPLHDPTLLRNVVERALSRQRLEREKHALLLELMSANEALTRTNADLLRTEDRLRRHLDELEALQDATVMSLTRLAEYRDLETGAHLERMRAYARLIADGLVGRPGYEEVDDAFADAVFRAAPLHDLGKIGVPDHILRKEGPLTPDEWEIMRQHPIIGGRTLEEAKKSAGPGAKGGVLHVGMQIAYYHHEHFDGSGYPFGLAGQAIPLAARIAAIADAYDAITSRRVYKPSVPHEEARRILDRLAGIKFDPDLVEVFLEREEAILAIRDHYRQDQAPASPKADPLRSEPTS